MNRLITAAIILGVILAGIIIGVVFNLAWLSGALCLLGWTPAAMFFGFSLAGLNFSISVRAKEVAQQQKITESPAEIKQRVSRLGQ